MTFPIFSDFVTELAAISGDEPEREGLEDTPRRLYEAWQHWCSGYGQDPKNILKTFEDGSEDYDEMVCQKAIPVWSHCEHHLAPFFGLAHVAYIPNKKIVGLSKLGRLVDVFSRRLQVQERITTQIADALQRHLEPQGVGVVLECRHLCMESRGIQAMGTITVTSALRDAIKDEDSARAEFLAFARQSEQGKML